MAFVRPFLMVLAVLAAGCRKDPAPPTGTALSNYIRLSADTSCLRAPNTITPNGDGINDRFHVSVKNITAVDVRIRNAQGDQVFMATSANASWDGTDSLGNGPYAVQVEALTSSQVVLRGHARLYVLDYGSANCLDHPGNPVCGDQFDPRLCDTLLATNEVFCP